MKKTLLFIFICSMILFSSCEKQKNDELSKTDNELKSPPFIVKDGILMFKSTSSFLETLGSISNFSDKDRMLWEKNAGFLSQRRIINQIIEEEAKLDIINEAKYTDMKNIDMSKVILHSDIYYKYLDKGVIKVISEGTLDEYWDYALIDRCFVDFVNEDGLYAIGDTLYQVTENSVKALTDGDFTKKALLIQAKTKDESNNIVILRDVSDKTYPGSPGLIETPWVEGGGGKAYEKRIRLGIFMDVYQFVPSGPSYGFFHEVYVQCQERNILRQWKYKFADIDLDGEWVIKIFWYPDFYGASDSYDGSVSYYKACPNPASGVHAPYQSWFGVTATHPAQYYDEADYPPRFDSYDWTVGRNGGCCGLTASLYKAGTK
jgi:hypothetical protein